MSYINKLIRKRIGIKELEGVKMEEKDLKQKVVVVHLRNASTMETTKLEEKFYYLRTCLSNLILTLRELD
ncbi:MAG: hypothetical protein QMC80_02395 [Thermoplasmatales archaeon]|nr:hypothetical protein [Thermoplasmatales archaeon]